MTNKLTPGSNLRWESMRMILPEQREMWLKHQEKEKKEKKPELDQQQWEEFEWLIGEAMQENEQLTFTYWKNGYFYEVTGCCHFVNTNQKQFHVKNEEDIHFILFNCIADIKKASDGL